MDLVFQGIYSPDFSLPENELIRSALAFIQSKGLDAEKLQCEIPMTLERLKEAPGSDASAEELELVHLLRLRYAKPDTGTIRLRLKVAAWFRRLHALTEEPLSWELKIPVLIPRKTSCCN